MRILKDKKGIALENAILFMLVIFSLCFLIASLTLIGHYQTKIDNILLDQKVELDQIGEDYLAYMEGKCSWGEIVSKYEDSPYTLKIDPEAKALTVFRGDANKTVALYVQVDADGSIIRWCYSDPNPTE